MDRRRRARPRRGPGPDGSARDPETRDDLTGRRPSPGPSAVSPALPSASMPDRSDQPAPARSPASASSTARRSSPGRIARCCSATSGPRSSRSSHPRVMRPAAGARRGSARSRPARGPPPTSSRSTATSGRSGSTSRPRKAPRSCAACSPMRDVLVENFRGDGFARLGFDDEALRALNPRLVHLAISGYGTSGPAAERPGYDFIVQAVSGLMSITGAADADGGGPTKVGVAISDILTGMLGAVGLLGALAGREREAGPRRRRRASASTSRSSGRRWPVSSTRHRTRSCRAPHRAGSATPIRTSSRTRPSRRPTARSPWRSGRSGSGRVCARRSAGRSSPTDPRFATNGDRVENRRRAAPDPRGGLRRADHRRLDRGPRRGRDPVRADQRHRRGVRVAGGASPWACPSSRSTRPSGVIRQVGLPFQLSATPASIRTSPPTLGQDTDAILGELGYDPTEIEALRARGVV